MKFPANAVAPSLLAADFARLADEIQRVETAGADFLHLDVMDAHFVPNISFGIPVIEAVNRVTDLKLDTHLMMDCPAAYLEAFRDAGTDSLTLHVEIGHVETGHAKKDTQLDEMLDKIRSLGMGCGLAVNPATPVTALYPYLEQLDLALVMSVEPGFGGQRFMPASLGKVKTLRQRLDELSLDLPIEIDGGIKADNAAACRQAGVDLLVAGSSIFAADDAGAAIAALRA
jgi:ribulose-phosphate 3-epimerase